MTIETVVFYKLIHQINNDFCILTFAIKTTAKRLIWIFIRLFASAQVQTQYNI
jgi:hypothetical protein